MCFVWQRTHTHESQKQPKNIRYPVHLRYLLRIHATIISHVLPCFWVPAPKILYCFIEALRVHHFGPRKTMSVQGHDTSWQTVPPFHTAQTGQDACVNFTKSHVYTHTFPQTPQMTCHFKIFNCPLNCNFLQPAFEKK